MLKLYKHNKVETGKPIKIMKTLLTYLLFTLCTWAQVGIYTTDPNINSALDIRYKPLFLEIANPLTSGDIMAIAPSGEVGRYNGSVGIMAGRQESEYFPPNQVVQIVSNNTYFNNNINLGLSTIVIIPANSTVHVRVEYSTPIGCKTSNSYPAGYIGCRMLVDGVLSKEATGKFSFSQLNTQPGNSFEVFKISGSHTETYTNNSPLSDMVIYEVVGILSIGDIQVLPTEFYWIMWDPINNYDQGFGFIRQTKITFNN